MTTKFTSPRNLALRLRRLVRQADLTAAALQVATWPQPSDHVVAIAHLTIARDYFNRAANTMYPPILGQPVERARAGALAAVPDLVGIVAAGILAPGRRFPIAVGTILTGWWLVDEVRRRIVARRHSPRRSSAEADRDALEYLLDFRFDELMSLLNDLERAGESKYATARADTATAISHIGEAAGAMPRRPSKATTSPDP